MGRTWELGVAGGGVLSRGETGPGQLTTGPSGHG